MSEQTQETQTENPKTIPYERFQEVIQEKNELKTRLDEAVSKMSATEQEREEFKSKYEQSLRLVTLTEVAAKYKLPAELASRLQGNTPEELEKDAELLSKLISQPNPGTADVPRGVEGTLAPLSTEQAVVEIFKQKRLEKK